MCLYTDVVFNKLSSIRKAQHNENIQNSNKNCIKHRNMVHKLKMIFVSCNCIFFSRSDLALLKIKLDNIPNPKNIEVIVFGIILNCITFRMSQTTLKKQYNYNYIKIFNYTAYRVSQN